ncbi:MAG: hypothetical protein ABR991_08475 [Terracidiphilus sp.]
MLVEPEPLLALALQLALPSPLPPVLPLADPPRMKPGLALLCEKLALHGVNPTLLDARRVFRQLA